ncbi:MAG: hypothetical protein M3162_04655 [Thermoproteota archaeon]|nr:hypothetical protein [Thermoproteota archaeon]
MTIATATSETVAIQKALDKSKKKGNKFPLAIFMVHIVVLVFKLDYHSKANHPGLKDTPIWKLLNHLSCKLLLIGLPERSYGKTKDFLPTMDDSAIALISALALFSISSRQSKGLNNILI